MAGNPDPVYVPSPKDTGRKKFGSYRIRYTGADGKRYSVTRKHKTDVVGAYDNERKAMELGTWVPPRVRKQLQQTQQQRDALTVGTWMNQWLERRKAALRISTWQQYKRVVDNRITDVPGAPGVAALAAVPLHKLDRQAVYSWWDEMNTAFDTENNNRKAYIYLRAAMADAVEREVIPANPVEVKEARSKPVPKEKELPTTEALSAIVEHTTGRYKLAVALCLFMGLRIGEALALTRNNLINVGTQDEPRWVVQVRGNLQRVQDEDGHSYMQWQEPKTQAGRRDVPVFDWFNDVVADHLDNFSPARGADYLTQTSAGKPVMDTALRNTMVNARRAAGVEDNITPHYGRNWLITHLAESGATPAEIGHLLGQTDLKTITEVYMKVRPDNAAAVMGRVGQQLGGDSTVVSLVDRRKKEA